MHGLPEWEVALKTSTLYNQYSRKVELPWKPRWIRAVERLTIETFNTGTIAEGFLSRDPTKLRRIWDNSALRLWNTGVWVAHEYLLAGCRVADPTTRHSCMVSEGREDGN